MEQLFKAIQEIARQNPEGFTVDLTTLKKVTKGISVAYLETQDSFGEEGLERVLNHALMHEKKVGGWLNEENGQFLMPVSVRLNHAIADGYLVAKVFKLLEDEMGVEEANKRIYATTDRAKGTLKQLADAQGWPTFVVPDDVGGRYSVLSAVGLLPIAAAGISIDELMKGAADAMERFSVLSPDNDAYKYAAIRNILYRKGKSIEILECYEPDFTLMNEWYKQLFGESEGKDNKGLFPASCIFSTDLHSMGQFIQEGSRTMFETIVDVKKPAQDLFIDPLEGNFDGLNFLANQNMSVVNRKAMEGTILAHTDGGVPEVVIEVDDLSAYNVGYLIYFFWRACACSGYLLSVNPFNQPGVESYKKNMFALLGKPGYENLTALYGSTLFYVDSFYYTVGWGLNLHHHLHSLQNHQIFTVFDLIADLYQNFDNL